ncbi:NAD(P)/FAD-dependent oxidoreductase [Proteiniclasticum ruminis]|uniref:Glycerol-3-phosphate dehydrogenase n=1 Tax=Proteiniclasticum ruminis TaxID=398199 RepID=A0A1I4YV93_9CLOT|nr:NAD(P)/FAD-dependent oxidoreductase [Proteiniclasticum ruminis]SFN41877.1 glycerol-3-phosphate dehydrogenase [Proteiniclasticum ruminis]
MYDVIIIGAGIVGTTIARELSKSNAKVLILEKGIDVSMGATKANSAIVHGGFAEKHEALKGRLCYKGRVQFRKLDEELNFGFKETGSLVISMEDDKEPLEKLMANGIKNGLDDLEIIGPERIRELEPELTHDVKWALYCKGAGICSPYEMAIAMAENAIKNGVTLKLEHQVTGIEKDGDVFKVTTDKEAFQGRYVVNAAGVYADEISKMVGVNNFEIFPRSGEYILFTRGTGDPINTVIFQLPTKYGKGVLVASTYYGNLLIGPDASDEGGKDDTSTHIERVAKIYQQTKALYGKINSKQFIRSFTGIRARSSTDDFIIEETKVKGFINVAGIQSPGLTSSPAIAEMVIGILKDAGLEWEDNNDFDPYRKPIVTKKPLQPLKDIKEFIELPLGSKDRIVCRCEQVREDEIVDALHRGIRVKTVDGVKRRTRAGMGWCQGEFCKPRVIEIMEREYGEKIDPGFDIEHSGVNRVQKSDLLDYLKSLEEE